MREDVTLIYMEIAMETSGTSLVARCEGKKGGQMKYSHKRMAQIVL